MGPSGGAGVKKEACAPSATRAFAQRPQSRLPARAAGQRAVPAPAPRAPHPPTRCASAHERSRSAARSSANSASPRAAAASRLAASSWPASWEARSARPCCSCCVPERREESCGGRQEVAGEAGGRGRGGGFGGGEQAVVGRGGGKGVPNRQSKSNEERATGEAAAPPYRLPRRRCCPAWPRAVRPRRYRSTVPQYCHLYTPSAATLGPTIAYLLLKPLHLSLQVCHLLLPRPRLCQRGLGGGSVLPGLLQLVGQLVGVPRQPLHLLLPRRAHRAQLQAAGWGRTQGWVGERPGGGQLKEERANSKPRGGAGRGARARRRSSDIRHMCDNGTRAAASDNAPAQPRSSPRRRACTPAHRPHTTHPAAAHNCGAGRGTGGTGGSIPTCFSLAAMAAREKRASWSRIRSCSCISATSCTRQRAAGAPQQQGGVAG